MAKTSRTVPSRLLISPKTATTKIREALHKMYSWCRPLGQDGREVTVLERNAYYVIIASMPIAIFLTHFSLWMRPYEGRSVLLIGTGVTVIMGILFVFLKLGYGRIVTHAIVLLAYIAVFVSLTLEGGIRDTTILLIPVILIFASIMLSGRTVLFYGGLISLSVIVLYWAEQNHLIPHLFREEITADRVVFVLLATGLMTFYLYKSYTQLISDSTKIQRQSKILQEHVNALEQIQYSLEQRTSELMLTNEHLVTAQKQLVEAEKMASLGNLIAGIAHELNTPIGIGITAITTLNRATDDLSDQYIRSNGQFRRSEFEEYLETATTSSQLIYSSLQRVDRLVQSFKQLSLDQLTLECRTFPLYPYLEEIVCGLEPLLRSGHHKIEVQGDREIVLHSYPGAIAQIVTNFVLNSINHGYTDNQGGHLLLDIKQERKSVLLTYQDDGCGIPVEFVDQIYEPFFTTARDRGGTGLGLHVVYNLVTQKLNGTIHHESKPGQGVLFTLELPLNI